MDLHSKSAMQPLCIGEADSACTEVRVNVVDLHSKSAMQPLCIGEADSACTEVRVRRGRKSSDAERGNYAAEKI